LRIKQAFKKKSKDLEKLGKFSVIQSSCVDLNDSTQILKEQGSINWRI
jgi:hypothetical protein